MKGRPLGLIDAFYNELWSAHYLAFKFQTCNRVTILTLECKVGPPFDYKKVF
jgi:hypothetical protein